MKNAILAKQNQDLQKLNSNEVKVAKETMF